MFLKNEAADQDDFLKDYYQPARRFCLHCKKSLSLKTYRAHKKLFFSDSENAWYLPVDTVSDPNSPPSISEAECSVLRADSPPCVDVLDLDLQPNMEDSDDGSANDEGATLSRSFQCISFFVFT